MGQIINIEKVEGLNKKLENLKDQSYNYTKSENGSIVNIKNW